MASDLERQITELKPGHHLCLIYEDVAQQMAAIVPFVRTGLARGERCLYIADHSTTREVAAALAAAGVDVQRERERGALVLLTKRETYLRGGRFEPEAMIALLRQALEEALAAGFTGLRATGEMTWALGPEVGCDRLIEYEATLNTFLPGARALAICQYDRRRFPPAIMRDVLRTHPVAILGDQVCQNLYYESPDLVLGQISEAERVNRMIANLERMRTTERVLRESEDRYRDLVEHSHDLICTHDLEGNILSVNPRAVTVMGCDPSELLMKNIRDFLTPEVRDKFDAYLVRIRSDGVASGLMQVQTSAGETQVWEYNNTLRTEGVAAPIVRGMARDITERKRAEEALAHALKERESIMETIPDILYLLDLGGNLVRWNRRVETITGFSPAELRGRPALEFFPEEDRAIIAEAIRTAFEQGYADVEGRLLTKDGTPLPYHWTGVPLVDGHGNVIGLTGVGRDITERKQAEEQIRREKKFSEMLINSSVDGILAFDRDCRYTVWNPMMERISGVSAEKCLGRCAFDVFPFLKETGEDRNFYAALEGRTVIAEDRPYNVPETGRAGFFEGHYSPLRSESREIVGGLAIIRDITERKRMEDTLGALYQASLQIQEPMGLQERLDRLLKTARDVLHVDRLNILLADPEGQWLQAVASIGVNEPLETIRVPIGLAGGGIAQAFRTQQAVTWDGTGPVPEELRLKPPYDRIEAFRSRVFANVPLVVQGRAIGVLG
ncbi:MAG TPA: PAS domain S-box protein, partial [Candidatus Methylomirabilis sp.]|nr:PAS domain S-box protein [Candidatus Methylomirabilis sp.]